jgi:hypothetical protein
MKNLKKATAVLQRADKMVARAAAMREKAMGLLSAAMADAGGVVKPTKEKKVVKTAPAKKAAAKGKEKATSTKEKKVVKTAPAKKAAAKPAPAKKAPPVAKKAAGKPAPAKKATVTEDDFPEM